MADEPENLVLLQLQGIRRETAALLDRQVRDRELISKVYNEVMAARSDVRELKSDFITLENQMQNRHNEVLSVIRRLDALGAPPD
jgi:predicted  nucleic acid-binding Zn-ribbon protein